MKRIVLLMFAILMIIQLSGCKEGGESENENVTSYDKTALDDTPFEVPDIFGMTSRRYTRNSTVYRFNYQGRQSIVVRPDEPLAGRPVVWRCEYFEAFDAVDKALLDKGWHIVYHSASDMYGCPESVELLHDFYDFAIENFGLSKKPVLFGFSRGALYAVNYAAAYPNEVGGIYLDAPVQDIRDWPCRENTTHIEQKYECMQWYGLNEGTLKTFDRNPIDRLEEIAHLPVIIVGGLADTVVHWELNGKITAERLEALGANVKVITKPDCDHHPHSLDDPTPVVEFIEEYCR